MSAQQTAQTRPPARAAEAVVVIGALLAWVVAGLAVHEAYRWPLLAVAPLTLVAGLLAGAVSRGTVSAPGPAVAGRAAVAVAAGVAVGELAALVIFAGPIDRHLDERALRAADSAPAVAQASAALQQARDARGGLDRDVEVAREHRDQALVVARCEYHPTPPCPQTRITGVPGAGPETRTANELLADARHELDDALAARDRRAPELEAAVSRQERAVAQARQAVAGDDAAAGSGLGARWVAMNALTLADAGALALRLVTIAFCALLYLMPLILRRWRGETSHDRHAAARVDRERAEVEADTAIAIKRAEVRREAEIMWAEHQLTQARLAIEAQTEIDREHHRRRVADAIEAPVRTPSRRPPADDDIFLPIAAEAEAASRAIAAAPQSVAAPEPPANLPAPVEPAGEVQPREERATPLIPPRPSIPSIPSIPDATMAAARWIRPLVPPFVARVIDNTTQPLRTVLEEVFEEDYAIRFSLRRTRRVTVESEGTGTDTPGAGRGAPPHEGRRRATPHPITGHRHRPSARAVAGRDREPELPGADSAAELRAPEGPRQLPPGT